MYKDSIQLCRYILSNTIYTCYSTHLHTYPQLIGTYLIVIEIFIVRIGIPKQEQIKKKCVVGISFHSNTTIKFYDFLKMFVFYFCYRGTFVNYWNDIHFKIVRNYVYRQFMVFRYLSRRNYFLDRKLRHRIQF